MAAQQVQLYLERHRIGALFEVIILRSQILTYPTFADGETNAEILESMK